MNRIIFVLAFVIMVIVIGPFLNSIKEREMCPKDSSFINGACCLDKNKDNVCDESKPKVEQTKVIEIREEEPKVEPKIITVEIYDLKFNPQELNISVGDTVVWINKEEKNPHKVYENFNIFRSPRLSPGESYNYTFNQPGEYIYKDAIFSKIMRGKINVKAEPMAITGSAVKLDGAKVKAISSLILIAVLLMINVLIYKKEIKKRRA